MPGGVDLERMVLRRFWRMLLRRVLRRILKRCLAVVFAAKKGSQKGFLEGERGFPEGAQSALLESTAFQVCPLQC